ncbi:3'-5' exonuclease [Paenibacillus apiarius]|uniref:3'-5' exonuclease n=1 Tax=Paenibacillus apiarius TaxID=46240 RepID=UPI00197EFD33|nr:3'-5' exonuclease [Paenibacillus apiarius]MBN3525175.1 UvrD-helicase domain-containing protein [Paenibacillus apiarius]
MSLSRDINIKPSFMRELHALPSQMGDQVWEKINFLAQNPIPDGRLKKKLNKWDNIYRLRIGDFRLFYSFGGNWIRLLSIRPRKNAYLKNVNYEEPLDLGMDADIADDEELAAGVEHAWTGNNNLSLPQRLPDIITEDWLEQLRIPDEYHGRLINCKTEDDLLLSNVPDYLIERVIDNLFPRPVQEILQQPDFIVFDTNDLIRYKEGDLFGFLLRLDSDQERLVDWALQGPALIKGGPGTGKSTIALYRVRSLLDNFSKQGKSNPKILFATFSEALSRFSKQLLEQLLKNRLHQVEVATADELVLKIAVPHSEKPNFAERNMLKNILERSINAAGKGSVLKKLRADYLLDEFEWVIEGQNLKQLDDYLSANRSGRGIALTGQVRTEVWECYQIFSEALQDQGFFSLSGMRCKALELVKAGIYEQRYDAVIIDEAQDLTPASLALLAELSQTSKGIYLTADASQSIYYSGFSWNEVHERLLFRGRAINLRRNYRTTREISEAAAQFMSFSSEGDPESLALRSIQSGPQPLLFSYDSEGEQAQLIVKFIKQMSRHLRLKASSAAVLVPSSAIGKDLAMAVSNEGLPCKFMRGTQLDLQSDEVKVLTLASSKGLEFPMVCIAGLNKKSFPRLSDPVEEAEIAELMKVARRTLYVGMTRAMRGLMVLYYGKGPSALIKELNTQHWFTGSYKNK